MGVFHTVCVTIITVQKNKGKLLWKTKASISCSENFNEVFHACERDFSKVAGVGPTTILNINSFAGISKSGSFYEKIFIER